MASEIKVNTIKDIGGNTIISSNGSGTFTSNLPSTTLTGSTNNQVTTVTGANAIVGESGLIFDGSKLGIGTSTMTRTLNVTDTASGASTGIQLIGANNGTQFINFGDTDDTNVGEINYDHSTNKMNFRTNDAYAMVIDTAGIVTKPLQSGFSATKSTSAQSVNAAYVSVNFNNEIWDNNADWNGSTTFTAPVTGKYMFTGAMRINSILAQGGSVFGRINTSNRPYVFGNITDADDVFNATVAAYQFQGAVVADMDANDTATLDFFSNFATTIAADAERVWFQGYLLG